MLYYIWRIKTSFKGYVDCDFIGDLDKRRFTTNYVFTLA